MRFIAAVIIILFCANLSVFAQNTQIPPKSAATPTVTIETKVVEIVLNDEHRQGVDWEAIVSDFHNLQLKRQDNPVWVDKRYRLSIGELSQDDYGVLLDALDTVGKVTQKDFPPVVLSKDESKSIDIPLTSKIFSVIRMDLTWFNSPAGEPKFRIEPAMDVFLKDSSRSTVLVKLKSQTTVDLKDSITVAMGGLISEGEITKMHKFPLLGDLPLVGLVFRKQGKLMQKTETMVFLTIHTDTVQMPEDADKN